MFTCSARISREKGGSEKEKLSDLANATYRTVLVGIQSTGFLSVGSSIKQALFNAFSVTNIPSIHEQGRGGYGQVWVRAILEYSSLMIINECSS